MSNFPSRHFVNSFEKRFQELERRLENMHRIGTVPKDGVKYDEEKKRWYVKLEQEGGYKSDWIPWETMSSGWLKISSPPYEGQSIQLTSFSGTAEVSSARPYHNNPDTPSPSDKKGEFHMRVEMPGKDGKPGSEKDKILDFHFTQDGSTVKIGDTTHELSKDTIAHTTKNNNVTTENDTKKVSDTHSLQTDKRVVKANKTSIQSTTYQVQGKVVIN